LVQGLPTAVLVQEQVVAAAVAAVAEVAVEYWQVLPVCSQIG
jgi:hypothetical protein